MPLGGFGLAGLASAASAGAAAKAVLAAKMNNPSGGSGGGILGKIKGLGGGEGGSANALTAVMGIGQKIKANRLKKQGEEALPQNEDPEMRKMQLQFARRKRAFQTGTASASKRSKMNQMFNTGMSNTMKYGTGGRSGLLKMQEMFSQAVQNQGESDLQGELSYAGMENKVLDKISQRKLELGMQRHDEKMAEAATLGNTANKNIGAVLGKTMGVGDVPSTPYFNERKKAKKVDETASSE